MNKMLMQFWDRERGKAVTVSTDNPMPGGGGSQAGGDALPEHVLDGRTFTNDDGQQTGTMYNGTGQTIDASVDAENTKAGNLFVSIDNEGYIDKTTLFSIVDENFAAKNIIAGVELLGLTGTATSNADATPSDIAKGKTAYVKGELIAGTLEPFEPQKFTVKTNAQSFGQNGDVYVLLFSMDSLPLKPNLLGVNVQFMESVTWEYEEGKTLDLSAMSLPAFQMNGEFIPPEQKLQIGSAALSIHFNYINPQGLDIIFEPSTGTITSNSSTPMVSCDIWSY